MQVLLAEIPSYVPMANLLQLHLYAFLSKIIEGMIRISN